MSAYLPEEVILSILISLSVKDLHRFKCVCRRWRDMIQTDSFIRKYQDNAREKFICFSDKGLCLLDVEETKLKSRLGQLNFKWESMLDESTIILRCRGALCVTLKNHSIAVWNPSTGKHMTIPKLKVYRDFNILGFGYDPLCDNYKIVTFVDQIDTSTAYIFEFKSDSWKKSLTIHSPHWYIRDRKGAVLDQNVYWIAYWWNHDRFVLGFNFTTERHQILGFPTHNNGSRSSWLGVMGRKLCVIEYLPMNKEIEIWTMERTDANVETWNNFITISTSNVVPRLNCSDYYIDFECFTKNNDLLVTFIKNNDSTGIHCTKKKVFLCKTKDKTFKEVWIRNSLARFQVLEGYFESLASIDFPS